MDDFVDEHFGIKVNFEGCDCDGYRTVMLLSTAFALGGCNVIVVMLEKLVWSSLYCKVISVT